MKREFVLGVLVLLSVGFVVAGSCEDNQTIMRLHNESNSHVSFWNESTYAYRICFNDIFGYEYSGENVHECTGANGVLNVHSTSNSHASVLGAYTNYICYGDLECAYEKGLNENCFNGGEVIFRLNNHTNAHVAAASDSSYPIKVCCTSNKLYWADMMGNEINETDFGDSVHLVYRGGDGDNMTVMERDTILHDNITTIVPEQNDNVAVGIWRITSEDMEKTQDHDEFYFETGGDKSSHLDVEEEGDNDKMYINITSFDCGSYYNESDVLSIDVDAVDADDLIDGKVYVDDAVVKVFSNGGISFNYTLEAAGNVQIRVDATNSRNERRSVASNIMVLAKSGGDYVDGKYVASCIASPEDYLHIDGSNVTFDASTTRGVLVKDGDIKSLVPGRDNFSWYWNFQPEGIGRSLINTTSEIAYKFKVGFPMAGENSASLTVDI